MKGISKRIYALLLAACLMVGLLPSAAYAATPDWSSGATIPGGTYDLGNAAITITGTLTIDGAVTIKNGTINRVSGFTGAMFSVGEGKSLTLESVTVDGGAKWEGNTDSVLERGTTNSGITASGPIIDAGYQRKPGGTVILNSETVLKNNCCSDSGDGGAVTIGEDGSLTINAGVTICNNANTTGNAGAIKAYAGATVTMNGGEIYGNQAYSHGGAIQIFGNHSTDKAPVNFTMSGGTIRNNKANGVGGAVAVSDYSNFVMTGGIIEDNATTDYSKRGGGVGFGDANTSMTVSGSAKITGNTAGGQTNNLYVGSNSNNILTVGTLSGANIGITMKSPGVFSSGGADYAGQFKSDKDDYAVVPDGNDLKLAPKSSTHTITVSASPTGGGTVTGGGSYTHDYTVTLVATADSQAAFLHWEENGKTVSTQATYSFTAQANRSLTAVFTAKVVIVSPTEDQVVTVKEGETAAFSIEANNANGYEWFVDKNDGKGFVSISGANGDSYTTPPVTAANDGWKYYCKVVNDADTDTTSPTFTLKIDTAPGGGGDDTTNPAPGDTMPTVSASSGIKVEYLGGNSFSTSRSEVPTSVEIDGVAVPFSGSGRELIVSGIPANARWITIRWNSTSVTTNFTHDGAYLDIQLPKTGDVSVVGYALMAVIAAAGAMLKK